jgi:hypothetical protein
MAHDHLFGRLALGRSTVPVALIDNVYELRDFLRSQAWN